MRWGTLLALQCRDSSRRVFNCDTATKRESVFSSHEPLGHSENVTAKIWWRQILRMCCKIEGLRGRWAHFPHYAGVQLSYVFNRVCVSFS